MTIKDFLEFKIINLEKFQLTPYHILLIIIVLVLSKVVLVVVKKLFNRQKVINRFDRGQRFALYAMVKYLIIIIAVTTILQSLGLNLNIVLGASGALLLGLGFGLQQIFRDFISGIILLMEGTIKVSDIIEVEGIVGKVKRIGFRTSEIETRDNIVIIMPNSAFTGDKVINWSHNKENTRFDIKIGVAYGSDVELVKKVLLDCVKEHKEIINDPAPSVRFDDFGDSSLDFRLVFRSNSMFRIEKTKSHLRFIIDRKFRENGIEIPFPQRDIHIKTDVSAESKFEVKKP
ncbi:MAG: mechanosensitive ion channel [Bacteroidetes bacterium]|nr:mechanosensitive ion channel [Bacteroidota bacterium]